MIQPPCSSLVCKRWKSKKNHFITLFSQIPFSSYVLVIKDSPTLTEAKTGYLDLKTFDFLNKFPVLKKQTLVFANIIPCYGKDKAKHCPLFKKFFESLDLENIKLIITTSIDSTITVEKLCKKHKNLLIIRLYSPKYLKSNQHLYLGINALMEQILKEGN